jgi:hypothetical protein
MATEECANILTSVVEDGGNECDRATCNGHNVEVRVSRPVYTRQDFNQKYIVEGGSAVNSADKHSSKFLGELRHWVRGLCSSPSRECCKKAAFSFLPFIQIMREYRIRSDLLSDVMAGLIVGIMHIPQGKLYASVYIDLNRLFWITICILRIGLFTVDAWNLDFTDNMLIHRPIWQ